MNVEYKTRVLAKGVGKANGNFMLSICSMKCFSPHKWV